MYLALSFLTHTYLIMYNILNFISYVKYHLVLIFQTFVLLVPFKSP